MKEKKSIARVSWEDVCNNREKYGLGIKHVGSFNTTMLSKWIWRFLVEDYAIRSGIMKVRYGDIMRRIWGCETRNSNLKGLIWWRDIMAICEDPNGALAKFRVKLGDGHHTMFWKHCWLRGNLFETAFPFLFEQVMFKEIEVSKMGVWVEGDWCWKLRQGEEVFGRETVEEYDELMAVLVGVFPQVNTPDLFVWPYNRNKCYTVKSCYEILNVQRGMEIVAAGTLEGMNIIWKAYVPSKVKIFGWRMLRDRLPTRKQLHNRQIIHHLNDIVRVFCNLQVEDLNHVLFNCAKLDWL